MVNITELINQNTTPPCPNKFKSLELILKMESGINISKAPRLVE